MKILRVDNFGRESVSDSVIAENVSEYYGRVIIDFLIEKFEGNNSSDYFKLVADDYKLYEFKP